LYVCICRAVTDDEVEAAFAGGANSLEAVRAATGAGSCCGTCHDRISELIAARCGVCRFGSKVA
jgi:bacterioferritin-associated ferredoxin